ncbi:hypothetical protein BC827DRAFT_1247130 [Russula dissimulans]|nr:hypothetical protein BC827DRAFT_1247130 [Russula dissimulans]
MAHYSSLFTLGLLSDRVSPPPSPETNIFYKFRKSSLPTRSLSKPIELSTPSESPFDPPQFTNPFANSPETTTELRSFLSLDLAADKSVTTRRLHSSVTPAMAPQHSHLLAPMSPSLPPARRPSRDSLRTLPSPRPAPSSALPEVPRERKEPHSLPPISIPSPSLFARSSARSSRPAGGSPPMSYRAPHSAPPVTAFSSFESSSSFIQTPSPASPLSSPTIPSPHHTSFMSFSSTGTSVRTARRRNVERSNALACLEGRYDAPGRVPRSTRQRNFMSMSDDEDEEMARDDEDTGGEADVEDDGDAPERSPRSIFKSSLLPSASRQSPRKMSHWLIDEEEDRVLPPATIPSRRQSPSSNPRSRSRRSTLESWFPLANFIDLRDDELQGLRSVVEIVNGL